MAPMIRLAGVLGLALLALPGCTDRPGEVGRAELAAQADEAIGRFASRLQARLQAAMQEGGPVDAIGVCHVQAPQIAASVSAESEWRLARTSLKLRNPENAPDAWERGVLGEFETRHAGGDPIPELTRLEILEDADGRAQVRYMRAIPTKPLCLSCHGESLAPDVARKLDELYPADEARGFAAGDIRGAFTLRKPL